MSLFRTIKELSHVLEVSPSFLRKEVKNGRLIGYMVGNSYRFKLDDVSDYIERSRISIKARQAKESKSVQTKLWD